MTTRSCYYPFPVAELLLMNFNFHVEHHVFPTAPWWSLRRIRAEVKRCSRTYRECVGIEWNLLNRRRPLLEVAIPAWKRSDPPQT
jgi:acyl-lipid omega-6 desaturase (Delta-12 desaturase)